MAIITHRLGLISGQALRMLSCRAWRRAFCTQMAGGTTTAVFGLGAPTATGTASLFEDSTGMYIDYLAAATNGNVGWTHNVNYQAQSQPIYSLVMKTGTSLSNVRWQCGLFSADPRASDDVASGHHAGFRFSSNASDTYWMCCTKDGTSQTAQSSGVTVATNTRYELTVDLSEYNSGLVHFYINGTRVYTSNANLPGSTQSLDPYASGRAIGSAVAQSIRIAGYQVLV